jgi:anti-sigma factor RsiW
MTTTHEPPRDDETSLLLNAHVDGELDPANALALERQIAASPALAAERARIDALRNVLREKIPPEPLPANLRRRVEASVGLRQAATGPSWRALAASVLLGMVLASGTTWFAMRPVMTDRVAEEALDDHLRALMASQPFDVASSDRHTVKPWFNGRASQAPRVVDLAPDGFTLVGGRIDVIGRTPVPTLVYRIRQHVISLLAVPAAGGAMNATVHRTINGYNLVGWTQDGVDYWAVSDVAAGDLEKFAELFRTASPER